MNGAKKSEQVLINLSPELHAKVVQIAQTEDRPLGYVARELMHRGLSLYIRDGLLRDRQLNGNVETVPNERVAYVRNLGELTDERKQKTIRKKAGKK